ncbi:MAG: AAA family ATPase [Flavobacterium sp.]|nr:AAA family ATPase [Flavobacterium sp.]
MIIKNIHIENFKGIENKDIYFNDQFTVLIGNNGAGKSSILDAVSVAMGTVLMKTGASFGYSGAKTRPLFKDEIRKVIISPDNIEYTNVVLSGQLFYESQTLDWYRCQLINAKSLSYKDASKLTGLGDSFAKNIQLPLNLPLFVHHTTARLWGNIYDKSKTQKIGSRLDGYYACLDSRSIKDIFFYWFKTFEDSALKFNKDKSLYNAFTQAITSVVPEWNKIHFSWELNDLMGLTNNNNWLPLRNLSDGYRSIVHLTADIAYRAIKLNPHLGDRAVIETEGIVMIDEIDMHLHPKWQRHIVDDLKRTFPKIQFIVTTHSPFIVQSLKADEVINLDGNELSENPDVLTIEENALYMGVTDDNSYKFERKEKLATEYLELLDTKHPSLDALSKLEELLKEFSDDPVFVAKLKLDKFIKLGIK